MKAWICKQYGAPNLLELKEISIPIPKDNEVLIKNQASSVNRTDCATIRAIPVIARLVTGLFKLKHPIPGTEFAGEVVTVGKDVTLFNKGERVFGFKETDFGCHAEYLTISEDKAVAPLPDSLSYEQGAISIEGAHYAINFINKVDLNNNHRVLINGATGGIGSAALQLIKDKGAFVAAVCNTKNIALIESLGADKIYDYTKEDFTEDHQKYHLVIDAVGKSSFGKCKPLLYPGGTYISSELGRFSQNAFLSLITPLFKGRKVKFPLPINPKGSLLLIRNLLEDGRFKPVLDRTYSLEKIVEAYEYVEKGLKTGNVSISIDH